MVNKFANATLDITIGFFFLQKCENILNCISVTTFEGVPAYRNKIRPLTLIVMV